MSDIKAYLKTQHSKLEEYQDSFVTRPVEQIIINDKSVEIKLKSGAVITVKK